MTPAELEEARTRARAEIERRVRAGLWTAGVRPHTEYQKRPLSWIVEKLGVPEHTLRWSLNEGYATHQWDGDPDPLIAAFTALADWRDVGIESATGTGKTYAAACLTLWFLACFENALIITVAPKEDQLLLQIWKEIGDLYTRFKAHFPQATLLPGAGKLRMRPAIEGQEKWAAFAFVCGVGASEEIAGKAKGFHSEHMLIISEETQSIDRAIMNSFSHTRTYDHNLHLALGNPDHQQDELHLFCEKPSVLNLRISAFDHPNIVSGHPVIPGALGPRRFKERQEECAPPDSRMFLSQLRGVCPAEAEEALIHWEWCLAAAARYTDQGLRDGPLALGVDVADSPKGDEAAIAHWQGACCTTVEGWQVAVDAEDVADRVYRYATTPETFVDPKHIGVDAVGVGASCVNSLRKRKLKVRALSSGERAIAGIDKELLWSEIQEEQDTGKKRAAGPRVVDAALYANLRSQMWWRLREDLRLARIALPHDEALFKDLTTPRYGTPGNKITVEPKEAIKKRLGRSPNKGDACVYGNWVRRRTPILPPPVAPHQPTPNKDTRLEQFLAKMEKRQRAERRQMERALKRRRKGRSM